MLPLRARYGCVIIAVQKRCGSLDVIGKMSRETRDGDGKILRAGGMKDKIKSSPPAGEEVKPEINARLMIIPIGLVVRHPIGEQDDIAREKLMRYAVNAVEMRALEADKDFRIVMGMSVLAHPVDITRGWRLHDRGRTPAEGGDSGLPLLTG